MPMINRSVVALILWMAIFALGGCTLDPSSSSYSPYNSSDVHNAQFGGGGGGGM